MKTMSRQSGVSVIGILLIVALFSFFLTVMLRLMPSYMEGRNVRTILEGVVENSNTTFSLRDVNKKVVSAFTTNQVEGITTIGRPFNTIWKHGRGFIDQFAVAVD